MESEREAELREQVSHLEAELRSEKDKKFARDLDELLKTLDRLGWKHDLDERPIAEQMEQTMADVRQLLFALDNLGWKRSP